MALLARMFRLLCFLAGGMLAASAVAQDRLRLVTLEYPPYIINAPGGAEGLAASIVREVFARMNQPISIEFYPWSRSLRMLASGEADALFTIKHTQERERTMLFPRESLLSQDYVFFVRKDSNLRFNGDFASLANATIGLVRNTSYGTRFDTALARGGFPKLEYANDYEHIFRMLLAGRVDAVICSHLVGLSFLRQMNGVDQVTVSGPPAETAVSYLVFTRARDTRKLAEAFDQALAAMRRDGTLTRLAAPYR